MRTAPCCIVPCPAWRTPPPKHAWTASRNSVKLTCSLVLELILPCYLRDNVGEEEEEKKEEEEEEEEESPFKQIYIQNKYKNKSNTLYVGALLSGRLCTHPVRL